LPLAAKLLMGPEKRLVSNDDADLLDHRTCKDLWKSNNARRCETTKCDVFIVTLTQFDGVGNVVNYFNSVDFSKPILTIFAAFIGEDNRLQIIEIIEDTAEPSCLPEKLISKHAR